MSGSVQVHPVVAVLSAHGQAVLVVHVVGLPLVPGLEAPGVSAGPLPRALLEVVHPARPVAVGVVTVQCLQPAHDEVVLGLAGGLGQEPVVLHAALLGLVPVEVSVVGAAAASVVVAAGDVVALGVAVPVVRAAHP